MLYHKDCNYRIIKIPKGEPLPPGEIEDNAFCEDHDEFYVRLTNYESKLLALCAVGLNAMGISRSLKLPPGEIIKSLSRINITGFNHGIIKYYVENCRCDECKRAVSHPFSLRVDLPPDFLLT